MDADFQLGRPASGARIVVAMSGGVDSSVVAALAARTGAEVIGITLQLYDHGAAVGRSKACCAGRDILDAQTVAQKLGIALPKMQFSSPQEAKEAKQRTVLLDLNETACQWFQEQLKKPEAAAAREYLKNRGLDQKAIELFRIGYAPESGFLLRDRLKGEADEDALRESGLFSWKENAGPSTPPLRGSAHRDRISSSL